MSFISFHQLDGLFAEYGYAVIFFGIMLESIGLPLPGESLMIAAALYAATTHRLSILELVPVAATGAIIGDQIGYFVGRWIGVRYLTEWGRKIGITRDRLDLGQFLFRKYGAEVVFFGRFVAILRTFAAVLAGANRMPWPSFLKWNALGGIGWTTLYGFGAYLLGDAAKYVSGPLGITLGIAATAALLAAFLFVKKNEKRLLEQAHREMHQGAP
jgi:membrane protein DedA with SNARE-associated domain